MFEKYLKDIGLSDKEASIYVALLGFDKASVAELSKKANVKRPTTYVVLVSLQKKGLVSEITINKKTFYIAEPPEKLDMFVERQIHHLQENKKSLDFVIPQLKSIQREGGEKPMVQFFDGKEGLLSSNYDIFNTKAGDEPAYTVYSRDLVQGIFSESELAVLLQRRISSGVKSKAIYNFKNAERQSNETSERMKIDENKYPITSDLTVYGDQVKVAFYGKRVSGISIKSKELAETLKSLIKFIFDHK